VNPYGAEDDSYGRGVVRSLGEKNDHFLNKEPLAERVRQEEAGR